MKRIGLVVALGLLAVRAQGQDVLSGLISPGPMSSAHVSLEGASNCTQCHQLAAGVPNEQCLACHAPIAERQKQGRGLHGKLGAKQRCIECHKEHKGRKFDLRGFDPKAFDHDTIGWPLKGTHAEASCKDCHGPTRSFLGAAAQCETCHKDEHKGQFAGKSCEQCHGTEAKSFKLPGFDHNQTSYPLVGAHAKEPCQSCHQGGRYKPLEFRDCASCHRDVHKGQFAGKTCQSCHTTPQSWKAASGAVEHDKTRFPLHGAHVTARCEACHKGGRFKLESVECKSCHQDEHKGQFPKQDCAACHNEVKFKPAVFEHSRARYPLTGKHAALACQQCHAKGRYRPLEFGDCASCHKDVHKGQFAGRKCDSCHTTQGWKTAAGQVDHDKTRFPLLEAHQDVKCEACHKEGRFKFETLECKGCHEDVHKGQFPKQDCASCHNQKTFKPSTFEHARAAFQLAGKHQELKCFQCHEAGRYKPLEFRRCEDCHKDEHKGQFTGKDCASCHNEENWEKTHFDHAKDSRFALLGKHRGVECAKCHQEGRYKPLETECASCHQNVHKDPRKAVCEDCHTAGGWSATRFPHDLPTFRLVGQHATLQCEECHKQGVDPPVAVLSPECASCHRDEHAGQLGQRCGDCHEPVSWTLVRFEHVDLGEQLSGVHKGLVACRDCHQENRFRGQSTECMGCHREEFLKAQSPNHAESGFTQCRDCHTQVAWMPASFDHDRFPLRGGHGGLQCLDCHKNGTYEGTSAVCRSCHQADYSATTNPNHARSGYPTTCEGCHTTSAWRPATINHDQFFPLVGAHRAAACEDCHRNGQYQGTPKQCVGCHQTEYSGTTNPNHAQSGFPTTCEGCHTTNAWKPASFNHDQFFPLVGAHKTAQCEDCHRNGQYQGTPKQCVGCHQTDYNGTTNPNHAQSGFPTTCEGCHSTSAWKPASFNHDQFFPLVGAHKTARCEDCHRNGQYQGTPKQCVGCHQTEYNGTTNPNHAQSGFPTTCEGCHSTSAWKPASFNHDQFFPLAGAHRTAACADCHRNGQYQGTPRQCVGCHQTDYNGTTNPNHAQNGFPTSCQDCHSTSAWRPASFDHSRFFPVPHRGVSECRDCHTTGNTQQFACIECHEHDRSSTDSHHREVNGYQYNSQACYNCHPKGKAD